MLRAYFRSGWAFFIPYLAAYLLYAWLRWPVNPADGGVEVATGTGIMENEAGMEGSPIGGLAFSFLRPPALLHIYWGLHAIHLVLAAIALWAWWRLRRIEEGERRKKDQGAVRDTIDAQSSLLPTPLSLLLKTAPWLCLGLLFWIPGLYLEWPSDPWEHLRRINEWHAHNIVTDHSAWTKSSYFLPYSLTQHVTGLTQLSWLNLYYTAVCLLLSWQYYLLARATGLKARASLVFVLLNALTIGNNIFSFYRYYGISSTILAQISAVALTRIAIGFASASYTNRKNDGGQKGLPMRSLPHALPALGRGCLPHQSGILTILLLTLLIGFNHIQGLGIAGAGILAVASWRLIDWKPIMLAWLSAAGIMLSVGIVAWFPRHAAIDDVFRPEGWLNQILGFNLFVSTSPAFERTIHIIGILGFANLVIGLWLVAKRNDLSGWLTLMPVLILILPCFALPFASMLASQKSVENIVVFHRLLFAVPLPLAMVVIGARLWPTSETKSENETRLSFSFEALSVFLKAVRPMLASAGIAVYLLLSAHDSKNRFWQSIHLPPEDLQLEPLVAASVPDPKQSVPDDTYTIEAPLIPEIRQVFAPTTESDQFRIISTPHPDAKVEWRIEQLAHVLSNSAYRSLGSSIEMGKVSQEVLIRATSPLAIGANRVIAHLTAPQVRWVSFAGHPPNSSQDSGKVILSNMPGEVSHVFSFEKIPVELGKRYQLSTSIRQARGAGKNYLAVIWYDRAGRMLVSNQEIPIGAGNPSGWGPGVYSYYGLVNQPAESDWTSYSISFGLGENAEIPRNASFLRAGVLLNDNMAEDSSVEFTDVILLVKPDFREIRLLAPNFRFITTPFSLAGRLSGHWLPQHVAIQQTGTHELRSHFVAGQNSSVGINHVSD